jgi:putative heme iron utilization protein
VKTAAKSDELKRSIKAALTELLKERPDLVREALAEALEDIGLVRAIEEGLKSEPATRQEVFAALKRTG